MLLGKPPENDILVVLAMGRRRLRNRNSIMEARAT